VYLIRYRCSQELSKNIKNRKGDIKMCREDRDDQWDEYKYEGGSMSREEFEYQCDVDDYGADESDNDPWDE